MDGTTTFEAMPVNEWDQTICSGEVRWMNIVGFKPTLQQRFVVTTYQSGIAVRQREEWRDVPTVAH